MMNYKNLLVAALLCITLLASREISRAQDAAPGGTADVTKAVQQAVQSNSLEVAANNDALGGDPASTYIKKLRVDYTIDGVADSKAVMEYSTLKLHPAHGAKLVVTKAVYGDLPDEHKVDVTGVVADAVQANKLSLPVNNESLHGDPSSGGGKALEVNYTVGGKAGKVVVSEGETLMLPLSKDGTGPLAIVSATYGVL